jgi:hypothetical protein
MGRNTKILIEVSDPKSQDGSSTYLENEFNQKKAG